MFGLSDEQWERAVLKAVDLSCQEQEKLIRKAENMSKFGFLTGDGEVYLERCPKCGKENWAPAVASGQCAWCGYKGKPEDVENK